MRGEEMRLKEAKKEQEELVEQIKEKDQELLNYATNR